MENFSGDIETKENGNESKEQQDTEISTAVYESTQQLQDLQNDVNTENLIKSINDSPNFQASETMKDFIKEKKRGKVIGEFFKIIGRLFSGKNGIGFEEFKNLNIESLQLNTKNESELKSMISQFENKINENKDIKKDLQFTYVLSIIKNKLIEKEQNITDKEELLKQNLQVGDVILLNKKVDKKDMGTKLLEAYDNNFDTDFGHCAIITSTDPLRIRHSTTENEDINDKDGYVEETDLNSYLNKCKCKGYDLISLSPPEDIKNKILNFSQQNLGKKYDSNAAIGGGLYGIDGEGMKSTAGFKRNKSTKDDCFNCVEIIAQALDQEKLQDITHPNEFLEYMDIFTPTYMTTIEKEF